MSAPEINLLAIATIASEKEEENDAFRSFLKWQDADLVDVLVHQLNVRISAEIDCTACGNCCKTLMISIAEPERAVFADHFNINQQQAEESFLAKGMAGDTIMSTMPCIFLDNNKCSIYEKRFSDCREFPHLHKDGFTKRLFSVIYSYGMCPIVFNVVEALKDELEFER